MTLRDFIENKFNFGNVKVTSSYDGKKLSKTIWLSNLYFIVKNDRKHKLNRYLNCEIVGFESKLASDRDNKHCYPYIEIAISNYYLDHLRKEKD